MVCGLDVVWAMSWATWVVPITLEVGGIVMEEAMMDSSR